MTRSDLIAGTGNVTVYRSYHPDPSQPPDGVNHETRYGVHLVECGRFNVASSGRISELVPGSAFIGKPGDICHYTHPDGCADVCLSVFFRRSFDDEHPEGNPLKAARRFDVAPSNRMRYLKYRSASVLGSAEPFAIEEWASELTAAAMSESADVPHYREHSIQWYQKRIDEARDLLHNEYSESQSLFQLARRIGMSPYHFARIFRELVGIPPHQYLRRIRLQRATTLLKLGCPVTKVCFDVGFSNLSHFVNSFRAHFGMTPSRVRRGRATS